MMNDITPDNNSNHNILGLFYQKILPKKGKFFCVFTWRRGESGTLGGTQTKIRIELILLVGPNISYTDVETFSEIKLLDTVFHEGEIDQMPSS